MLHCASVQDAHLVTAFLKLKAEIFLNGAVFFCMESSACDVML